jgi:hypothetical protein
MGEEFNGGGDDREAENLRFSLPFVTVGSWMIRWVVVHPSGEVLPYDFHPPLSYVHPPLQCPNVFFRITSVSSHLG